jgi:hypothetical protein
MIGQNINAYFDAAMMYPVERLEAVIRGQDKSIPAAAAMMALPLKQREMAAAGGMQAMQQPQQPSIRQQMAQATMPQMAPQSPQGMQQIPQQSPQVAQLPENTGVMNIPAPNMQKMADGGIVAFDDGGYVDRYDDAGLTTSSPLGRFASDVFGAKTFDPNTTQELQKIDQEFRLLSAKDRELNGMFGLQQQTPQQQAEAAEVKQKLSTLWERSQQLKSGKPAATPAAPAAATTTPPAQTQFVDAKTQATKAPPVAEKKKDVGIGNIPKPAASSSMSYEDTLKKVGAADKELLGQYEKLGKEETAGMEALLKEKELNRPKGKVGESLEKYLKGKESADVNKRAENINSAVTAAGLEIAVGDSPSILQNIARGVKTGNASYRAGIDKLDAAADERAKMFASINDARLAEEKGDFKELYAAKADIKKHEFAYRKYGIDALVKLTGESRKVAADIFTNAQTNERALQVSQMSNATELQKAKIMANAYGAKSNPYNIAEDNAAKEYDTWSKSPEGKMLSIKDPTAAAAMKRQIYSGAYQRMQLPDPFGKSAGGKDLFKDPKEQAAYEAFAGG